MKTTIDQDKPHIVTPNTNVTGNAVLAPLIAVDFKRPRPKALGGGLYRYGKNFFERPTVNGGRTWRKLDARTVEKARLELANNRSNQALSRKGLAEDPYKRTPLQCTVGDLLDFYMENGCPKRDESPREGRQLKHSKTRIAYLREFFGKQPWKELTNEHLRAYHSHRKQSIKEGKGNRTIDMELQELSASFRWAQRNPKRTGVTNNPIAHERTRFCNPKTVRHCREVQPRNAEELHQLAVHLFQWSQSQVLAWQLLFEAFVGHRTHEILRLRMDAKNEQEPGFVQGEHLFLYDSETSKGTYPYIKIHAALKQCLEAHKEWHAARYPNSPWYFPSPFEDGKKPVSVEALTKALRRACPKLGMAHRTSHGLRSFHVNVLRSKGLSDAEIALRIGHQTGGKLIVEVYGKILPYKLDWLPEAGDPAWTVLTSSRPVQLQLAL